MPPLKLFSRAILVSATLCCAQFLSLNLQAVEFEITPFIGQTFSPDLVNGNETNTLPVSDEPNVGLAFSWLDSPSGQGQVIVNFISRDFKDDNQLKHSFDTIYAHFNGVALFRERNYITTVSLGLGATYFDSDFDDVIYPSLTAAVGTRYEFSDNLALVTELRMYATLTDEDEQLFCQADNCVAQFENAIWLDSQISIGIAYRF